MDLEKMIPTTDRERHIAAHYERRLAELGDAYERVFDALWSMSPYWHLAQRSPSSNLTRLLAEASATIQRAQERLQRKTK